MGLEQDFPKSRRNGNCLGYVFKFPTPRPQSHTMESESYGSGLRTMGFEYQGDSTNQETQASLGAGCGEHGTSTTQGQHLPLSHNNPGAWRVLKELSRGAVQVTHSLGLCDSNLEQYHS